MWSVFESYFPSGSLSEVSNFSLDRLCSMARSPSPLVVSNHFPSARLGQTLKARSKPSTCGHHACFLSKQILYARPVENLPKAGRLGGCDRSRPAYVRES